MEKEQIIKIAVPAGKKAEWVDGFLKLVDNGGSQGEETSHRTSKDLR